MTTYKSIIIFSITFIAVLIISGYLLIKCKSKDAGVKPIDTHEIDSLKQIIKAQQYIINIYNVKLDSLYSAKSKITNNYATTIKDFSDPSIVTNDSICKYISSKLYIKR